MRRLPFGGTGWLFIAAAAAPIIIKSAKPIARKIGEAMEKYGKNLQESAQAETRNKEKSADRPESGEPSNPNQTDENLAEDAESAATLETELDGAATEPAKGATKVRQSKPKAKSPIKPKPKKTVRSSPSTKGQNPPEA